MSVIFPSYVSYSKFLMPSIIAAMASMNSLNAVEGPDALPSKGYSSQVGTGELVWGGYGELHYNNKEETRGGDQIDLHRLVFFAEYAYDHDLRFVTEVEIEHALAGEGKPGEVEVEQAYIDFAFGHGKSVQAGVMLMPIGSINVHHEPPYFHGVERPNLNKVVIPTTWWEGGVSFKHQVNESFGYQVMFTSALNSDGFSASGIRGGRQKTAEAQAGGSLFTGRVDYTGIEGLKLGLSGTTGRVDQDAADETHQFTLIALDYHWSQGAFEVSGEAAYNTVSNPEDIDPQVSGESYGAYITLAYDLFSLMDRNDDQQLQLFGRYEYFNTQADVADGVAKDESKIGSIYQIGLSYRPHPQVVLKADYQDWDLDDDSGVDRFNAGIGWYF